MTLSWRRGGLRRNRRLQPSPDPVPTLRRLEVPAEPPQAPLHYFRLVRKNMVSLSNGMRPTTGSSHRRTRNPAAWRLVRSSPCAVPAVTGFRSPSRLAVPMSYMLTVAMASGRRDDDAGRLYGVCLAYALLVALVGAHPPESAALSETSVEWILTNLTPRYPRRHQTIRNLTPAQMRQLSDEAFPCVHPSRAHRVTAQCLEGA